MKTKNLFSLQIRTNRVTLVVYNRGLSIGSDGISYVSPALTFLWIWPSKRVAEGHVYADEMGLHYRTLRELKAGQNKPNVAIAFDRINRIH